MEENKTKAKIIAVAGKGGVGKTSLCSAIVRELVEAFPGKRILAIDADPAVGLSTALGVQVHSRVGWPRYPHLQGFMAHTSMNRLG